MSIFNPNPQAKESRRRTLAFRLLTMMLILMAMLFISPELSEAQGPRNKPNKSFSIQQLEDGSYIVEGGIFVKAEAGFKVAPDFSGYKWKEIKRIDLSPNRSNSSNNSKQSNQEAILYHISPTPSNLAEYERLADELMLDSMTSSRSGCVGVNHIIGSPNTGATGLSGSQSVSLSTSNITPYFEEQWAFNQFESFEPSHNRANVEIAVFDSFRHGAANHWQGEIDFDAFSEVTPIALTSPVAFPDMPEHGEMIISQIHYLAPTATILPVHVLNENLLGNTMTLIEGLNKVIERKESNPNSKIIINMSLGLEAAPNSDECDIQTMNDLLNTAESEDIIVVAAAGNDADDENESRSSLIEGYPQGTQLQTNRRPNSRYPASHETVIAVAASNSAGQLANYSNLGEVMIAGGEISGCMDMVNNVRCLRTHGLTGRIPTSSGNGFVTWQEIAWEGTSFAAPLVSGLVAKLLYCNPSLTPDEVQDSIHTNSNQNNLINVEYTINVRSCAW